MEVRKIIIDEFKIVFKRHGYNPSNMILNIAEMPFNLASIQIAIDRDLERLRFSPFRRRQEIIHEEQLRNLTRQYAIYLLQFMNRGQAINEEIAYDAHAKLKDSAAIKCDIYPCSNSFRVR